MGIYLPGPHSRVVLGIKTLMLGDTWHRHYRLGSGRWEVPDRDHSGGSGLGPGSGGSGAAVHWAAGGGDL